MYTNEDIDDVLSTIIATYITDAQMYRLMELKAQRELTTNDPEGSQS